MPVVQNADDGLVCTRCGATTYQGDPVSLKKGCEVCGETPDESTQAGQIKEGMT
jgi:ribosomal protein L37E